MKRLKTTAVLWALVVLFAAPHGWSEMLGPGTYHGYFNVTRWGQKVLHLGPYHLFVSDDAARVLEEYHGQPLQVEVSKLSQPINPGAGLIQDIEKVSVNGTAQGLVLSAAAESRIVPKGEGVALHLRLTNSSKEPITIHPGTLAIVLVTDSPFSNEDIGYKDPNDAAYWYHHDVYHSFEKGKEPLRIACRKVMLPWTAKDLVERGHKIRLADEDRGFDGPVVVEPEGTFEADYVAGKELLPDDYEVFFYITSGNLSSIPGPMSERIPFDVVATTEEAEALRRGSLRLEAEIERGEQISRLLVYVRNNYQVAVRFPTGAVGGTGSLVDGLQLKGAQLLPTERKERAVTGTPPRVLPQLSFRYERSFIALSPPTLSGPTFRSMRPYFFEIPANSRSLYASFAVPTAYVVGKFVGASMQVEPESQPGFVGPLQKMMTTEELIEKGISDGAGQKDSPAEADLPDGGYRLPLEGAQVREGIEYQMEGTVVAEPEKAILPSDLKSQVKPRMSLQELVGVLGPGWMYKYSGVGSIKWFFDNGTAIYVILPPSLDAVVDVTEYLHGE